MMSVYDLNVTDALLTTTRSVRKRLDLKKPVSRDVIMRCIELSTQAPTGSNQQNWRWMVVTDAQKRRALADLYYISAMPRKCLTYSVSPITSCKSVCCPLPTPSVPSSNWPNDYRSIASCTSIVGNSGYDRLSRLVAGGLVTQQKLRYRIRFASCMVQPILSRDCCAHGMSANIAERFRRKVAARRGD
jgi:nitroreductase